MIVYYKELDMIIIFAATLYFKAVLIKDIAHSMSLFIYLILFIYYYHFIYLFIIYKCNIL